MNQLRIHRFWNEMSSCRSLKIVPKRHNNWCWVKKKYTLLICLSLAYCIWNITHDANAIWLTIYTTNNHKGCWNITQHIAVPISVYHPLWLLVVILIEFCIAFIYITSIFTILASLYLVSDRWCASLLCFSFIYICMLQLLPRLNYIRLLNNGYMLWLLIHAVKYYNKCAKKLFQKNSITDSTL